MFKVLFSAQDIFSLCPDTLTRIRHGCPDPSPLTVNVVVDGLDNLPTTRRSEQWRGEEGERRKVTVYEYTWDEEEKEQTQLEVDLKAILERRKAENASSEVTTHVSIHTLHLDGFRELYRQFLR